TLTVGAVLVNTRMPSEVLGSLSGFGSCMKKPLFSSLVTTPRVVTLCPTRGLMCPLSWMVWMETLEGAGEGEGEGPGDGAGAPLQGAGAVLMVRGAGATSAKSALLLFVSVQPPPRR